MEIKRILKKSILFILLILFFLIISNSKSFSMDVKNNSIMQITELGDLSNKNLNYLSSAMDNNKLVLFVKENTNYYLLEFELQTLNLSKIKQVTPTMTIYDKICYCEIRENGNIAIAVYSASSDQNNYMIFDKNFNFLNNEKLEKSIEDIMKQKAKTNEVYSDGNPKLNCAISEELPNIVTFYNDSNNIYIDPLYTDNYNYITDKDNKIFKVHYKYDGSRKLSLRIYDYLNPKIYTIEATFKDITWLEWNGISDFDDISVASLNSEFVFFVVNTKNGEIPCIWKYTTSSTLPFDVKKFSQDSLSKENNNTIKSLKTKYDINNIYIDKKNASYKYKVSFGSKPIDVYFTLSNLQSYIEDLPNNMIKDIKNTKLNKKHKFNIYLVNEIKAKDKNGFEISSYASTDKTQCKMELSTSNYGGLDECFIKLIDQRITEYYKKKNKDWNKMWLKLKNKDKHSNSKMSGLEDRAYVFKFINDEVWPYDFSNHKDRAKLLCDSIRLAFPSVDKCQDVYWEKWIMLPPLKVTTKTNTNSISVSWNKTKKDAQYKVQRKKGSKWETINVNINNNSFKIDNLKPGTRYQYRIRSYGYENNNVSGEDAIRNYKVLSDWVYIDVATKPETPKIKSAKSNKRNITVKWKKVSKGTGYQIKYTIGGKSKKVFVKNIKSYKYTLKNLKNKKKYEIKIRAYKSANGNKFYSSWSKTLKTKTK